MYPDHDGGNEDAGQEIVSALVVASGDCPENFQALDAAFEDVTALVSLCVKVGRTTSPRPAGQQMLLGILALGTDTLNAPVLDFAARLTRPIGPVHPLPGRVLSRPARAKAGNGDSVEHGFELADSLGQHRIDGVRSVLA